MVRLFLSLLLIYQHLNITTNIPCGATTYLFDKTTLLVDMRIFTVIVYVTKMMKFQLISYIIIWV
jgi:hypothetical protein